MLESMERTETGPERCEVAEVRRLADFTLAEDTLLLGASDMALAALISSPSQPEDSAKVTRDLVVASRMAS